MHFLIRKDLKVFRAIICFYTIYMVHNFLGLQLPPQFLFRHPTMNQLSRIPEP